MNEDAFQADDQIKAIACPHCDGTGSVLVTPDGRRSKHETPGQEDRMTDHELDVFRALADAYRIIREAYYHDMHKEQPAKNELQEAVAEVLKKYAASPGGDTVLSASGSPERTRTAGIQHSPRQFPCTSF